MTPNSFQELEEGDYLKRWVIALTEGEKIIIADTETIREDNPAEYHFLIDNHVRSVIAVPFWKRPTGFLIVRNPKRYLDHCGILHS